MSATCSIVRVAIPAPLRKAFDYLCGDVALPRGARVKVPFGRREAVGLVLDCAGESEIEPERLKRVSKVLDEAPLIDDSLLGLLEWVARYYHHPVGEVVHTALPVLLRQGAAAELRGTEYWALTETGHAVDAETLRRAPRQQHILQALKNAPDGLDAEALRALVAGWRDVLRRFTGQGWVARRVSHPVPPATVEPEPAPSLTPAQQQAVAAVDIHGGFGCNLLFGITGSGKTEVYLALAEKALAAGKQVLVLIPEIGLTPQLVERFRRRLATPVVALHSGLNDSERLQVWLLARLGKAGVVLGTRSAVFTPFPNLGLVIVDEEHDGSYKQQDGLRYHARDVAVMRASRANIPIVLGSATPSLDTLHKAREGRYHLLELNDRAASGALPRVDLLDMRRLAHNEGLSHPMLVAIRERLARGEQSLVFLNRRGFAPVLMCYDCGWIAPCPRCDARLTMHKGHNRLRCHHCGAETPLPQQCPECEGTRLHPMGEGTERLEEELNRQFPDARVLRIDRDTTRRKGALELSLNKVREGEADILVGTQMLAKGHDFPNITLVGVVNADQGLYGADFRSAELLMQQVVQVAGRAGRADKPGQVLIQTWHPGHPVFAALQQHDYRNFADYELAQRRDAGFPPFTHLALLRAESKQKGEAMRFLAAAYDRGRSAGADGIELWEPQPSTMERRAGFYRAQLLVQCADRKLLHPFLDRWLDAIDTLKLARQVRWSLDVDPADLY